MTLVENEDHTNQQDEHSQGHQHPYPHSLGPLWGEGSSYALCLPGSLHNEAALSWAISAPLSFLSPWTSRTKDWSSRGTLWSGPQLAGSQACPSSLKTRAGCPLDSLSALRPGFASGVCGLTELGPSLLLVLSHLVQ